MSVSRCCRNTPRASRRTSPENPSGRILVAVPAVPPRRLPFGRRAVQAHPRRAIPVVGGGHSPPAYRRAVERGNGWYGFALTPETAAAALVGLRRAGERYRRTAELGDLEITVTPKGAIDQATAARYAALGVERLILMPPRHLTADALVDFVANTGAALITRP